MTQPGPHPAFPNPVIVEALCEIHFRLPDGVPWRPAFASELYQKIQKDFPEFEPVTNIGLQIETGETGLTQALRRQDLTRYRHASGQWLIQMGTGIFTVNVLAPYPGWATVKEHIREAWGSALSVLKPEVVSRLGLRYINAIPRRSADESAGAWLKPSAYIPKAILESGPGFFYRLEASRSASDRLVVTLAERERPEADKPKDIVLDIDCIHEETLEAERDAIESLLERLHENEWCVFEASLTKRLIKLMSGGLR